MMFSNTPSEIVAELRETQLAKPRHTLVLVEGNTDSRLLEEYAAENCILYNVRGKDKLWAAIHIINRKNQVKGVAAIVDPDFLLVEQSDRLNTENVLFYDQPDLELMLVHSPAFEKVLRHTIDSGFAEKSTSGLVKDAIRLAIEFGYFRYIHHLHPEYSLRMNNVSFGDAITERPTRIDNDLVAERLSKDSNITKSELLVRISRLRQEIEPQIGLCNGKDVLSILAYLLATDYSLSDKVKIQTRSNELSRTIRLAYEFTYFKSTQLYRRIREWESKHSPYRIIKDFPLERNIA